VTPLSRWAATGLAGALLIASPHVSRLLPVDDPPTDAATLLALAQDSTDLGFSGYVESQGDLDLPVTDSFSELADLLVDRTRMRVWWTSPDRWRVDTLEATGESDLVHNARGTLVWDYERNEAILSFEPRVRLPRASDLLPNELARHLLTGATPAEVTRIPAERVAGLDAPGIRLEPAATQSSIDHADIWVDPVGGLPVRVAVYGRWRRGPVSDHPVPRPRPETTGTAAQPLLHTARSRAVLRGRRRHRRCGRPLRADPHPGPAGRTRPTRRLRARVGTYGYGATVLFALPLQEKVATPLRDQLAVNARTRTGPAGSALDVGPINVLVTPAHLDRPSWLLAGTVNPQTLRRAAHRVDVPVAGGEPACEPARARRRRHGGRRHGGRLSARLGPGHGDQHPRPDQAVRAAHCRRQPRPAGASW
jgi:hypothetical protein